MNKLKSIKQNGLVLVLNFGSSSLKFCLFHFISLEKEFMGSITGIGSKKGMMETSGNGKLYKKVFVNLDLETATKELKAWVEENIESSRIVAVGYRVVQGGPKHISPELICEKMLTELETYIYLAPNHLPDEIRLIRAFRNEFIGIPHLACFDTFFHKDMPARSKFYPLPEKHRKMGLVRYGFHGLSCESIFQQLLEEDVDMVGQKIIIAHLGSGSSITAISNGISQDTSMGISPMGGLVMATRSGDLDPGVILFLLKQDKLSIEQLDKLLSTGSGLKAIAGTSDMQEIIENSNKNPKAVEALDLFCYQAKKQIGAFAAAMGGIDLLVFCGGIGENAPLVREKICKDMEFIGISIDTALNEGNEGVISCLNSKASVRIIHTEEEFMIATHVQNILVI
jgi:acetate kinase